MKILPVVFLTLTLSGCASLSLLEAAGILGVADVTLFKGQIGVEMSKVLNVVPEEEKK